MIQVKLTNIDKDLSCEEWLQEICKIVFSIVVWLALAFLDVIRVMHVLDHVNYSE